MNVGRIAQLVFEVPEAAYDLFGFALGQVQGLALGVAEEREFFDSFGQ